jgi:protein ImuB
MFAAVHGADLAQLARCVADFSPYVEETSPSTVVISIDGLAHLFGSPREIAEAIARRAADLGLAANVAVADNPDLAVHGARGFSGVTVMEPGREASLPIALLDPREEIALTLALWGIRTFGEFAALPADGVAERLGAEGAHLQRLARGAGSRPLAPSNPAPPFEESIELEHPLALLEPLAFLLGRLLHNLCARLEARGLAAHELKLSLALEGAGPHERTLRLPYPMRAAATFLKLLSLDLEMHPPGAPVTAVSLSAEPVNPRVVQHGLFIPLAPEPQKLELTLARIAKLVGEGNAGSPELMDTHRRGQYTLTPISPVPENRCQSILSLVLRLFRPTLRAEVEAPDRRPARVLARGVRGRVLESAGPWRTAGDWWREDAWSCDEWDVALSDGALYLLCRDRRDGAWFVEGTYD